MVQVKARVVGTGEDAHVVPDREGGDFTAGRVLGMAEGEGGVGGGLVDVELWAEEIDINTVFQSAGFTARWRVDRSAVYGGATALEQPLPDGVAPLSEMALGAVYTDADEAKVRLDDHVAQLVESVRRRKVKGAGAIVVHAPDAIKLPLRAETKCLAKYRRRIAR